MKILDLKRFYKKTNGRYPDRVFFYRDGVSDGQMPYLKELELRELKNTLKAFGTPDQPVRYSFVVVKVSHLSSFSNKSIKFILYNMH